MCVSVLCVVKVTVSLFLALSSLWSTCAGSRWHLAESPLHLLFLQRPPQHYLDWQSSTVCGWPGGTESFRMFTKCGWVTLCFSKWFLIGAVNTKGLDEVLTSLLMHDLVLFKSGGPASHRNRTTSLSIMARFICRNAFLMSPMKAIGCSHLLATRLWTPALAHLWLCPLLSQHGEVSNTFPCSLCLTTHWNIITYAFLNIVLCYINIPLEQCHIKIHFPL